MFRSLAYRTATPAAWSYWWWSASVA